MFCRFNNGVEHSITKEEVQKIWLDILDTYNLDCDVAKVEYGKSMEELKVYLIKNY
jgi:hypothetical protein